MRTLLASLVLVLVSANALADIVRFSLSASAGSAEVRLSDISSWGSESTVNPIVATFDDNQKRMVLQPAKVINQLRKQPEFADQQFENVTPISVRLVRPASQVKHTKQTAKLTAFIRAQHKKHGYKDIELSPLSDRVKTAQLDTEKPMSLCSPLGSTRQCVSAYSESANRMVSLWFSMKAMVPVYRLNVAAHKGVAVRFSDYELQWLATDQLSAGLITRKQQLEQKIFARNVKAGELLSLHDVQDFQDIVAGQKVLVSVASGKVTIATQATALTSGDEGEMVFLSMNGDHASKFKALVVGPKTAKVN